jgi:hypothetical protein
MAKDFERGDFGESAVVAGSGVRVRDSWYLFHWGVERAIEQYTVPPDAKRLVKEQGPSGRLRLETVGPSHQCGAAYRRGTSLVE